MKILKFLVLSVFLLTMPPGLPPTLQSAAEPRQTTSAPDVFQLTGFESSKIDNKIRIESNNDGAPLLGSVLEDNGIPLLDAVIEDAGIPLLDVTAHAINGGNKN